MDWRYPSNFRTNAEFTREYTRITGDPTVISSINTVIESCIYFKTTDISGPTIIPKNTILSTIRTNTKATSFQQEITRAAQMWEGYKIAFFNGNDATAVLRASFLISYLLFKFEFAATGKHYPWIFESLSDLRSKIPQLRAAVSSSNANKQLGFDYKGAGNPPGFGTGSFYSSMVLLKKSALSALTKNGILVDVGSPEYMRAENDMVSICENIANRNANLRAAANRGNVQSLFKYTFYGPQSKFINSFFYHSLAMFGWWGCYGIRASSSNTNPNNLARGFVPTERPGSCNVAGLLNMYLWKKMNKLDELVYIAHGHSQVSKASEINSMTATRAAGADDVQFCHHGWQRVGNRPVFESGIITTNNRLGRWWQKTLYSHSDAFDVLTLTPIFRCIQRLRRQNRTRVEYPRRLVSSLNTRIKDFLEHHLFSTLPSSVQNRIGEMTASSVLPSRLQATGRMNNTAARQAAARNVAARQAAARNAAARQAAARNAAARNAAARQAAARQAAVRAPSLNTMALNELMRQASAQRPKWRNMVNAIQSNKLTSNQARAKYPNFFRGLQNNTVRSMVNAMRNNKGALINNVSSLVTYGPSNLRVNNGPVAERIAARIRNMNRA